MHTANELNNHVYRLLNQLSKYAPFIKYMDTYLNSMYSKFDFKDWIYTLNSIVKLIPINNPNDLKYARFKYITRDKIYRILLSYYKLIGIDLKTEDLRCLYILYEADIITEQHINNMSQLISDKPTKQGRNKKSLAKTPTKLVTSKPKEKDLEIIKYTNSILSFIKGRTTCNTCPLKRRGFLILNTNKTEPGPIDILFISDGASEDEIISQSHGLESRDYLIGLCDKHKLRYAFVNLTMCNINRVNTAKLIKESIVSCSSVFNEIEKMFPTNLSVLVGDNVRMNYGIKGGRCSKLNGKNYGDKIVSVGYDKLTGKALKTFIVALEAMIDNTHFKKEECNKIEIQESELTESKRIANLSPDMMLYDVKEIGNNILYIFTDKDDEKVYYTEDLITRIYVQPGTMENCEYVSDFSNMIELDVNIKQLKSLKRKLYHYK